MTARSQGSGETASPAVTGGSNPDPDARIRDALAAHPHGFTLAAVRDETGEATGVVGTLVPASTRPPLVLFLADRTSPSLPLIRTAGRLGLNLLAHDQEPLIRSHAPLREAGWRPSDRGTPIVDGAICWLDCDVVDIHEVGDRFGVVGAIVDAGVERNVMPLVGFQGGVGGFVAGPLSVSSGSDRLNPLGIVDTAIDKIDLLAQELEVECSLIALDGDDTVAIAAANHSPVAWRTHLGKRVPVIPPSGVLFVGGPGSRLTEQDWLARLGAASEEDVALARRQLERARSRGWSAALVGELKAEEIDDLVTAYSESSGTPEQKELLLRAIRANAAMHEPDDFADDRTYDVLRLEVPITSAAGETLFLLRLRELPSGATGAEVKFWLRMAVETAQSISHRLASGSAGP